MTERRVYKCGSCSHQHEVVAPVGEATDPAAIGPCPGCGEADWRVWSYPTEQSASVDYAGTGPPADLPLPSPDTEAMLQRTIANIHAVAVSLLQLRQNRHQVVVGVRPHSSVTWVAFCNYEGFSVQETRSTIGEALRDLLGNLLRRVMDRLEDDTRLVAALDRRAHELMTSHMCTKDGVRQAILGVPGVVEVTVDDRHEAGVGVATVNVQTAAMTLEQRDQMCMLIGQRLERVRPASVRFELRVLGLVDARNGQ